MHGLLCSIHLMFIKHVFIWYKKGVYRQQNFIIHNALPPMQYHYVFYLENNMIITPA